MKQRREVFFSSSENLLQVYKDYVESLGYKDFTVRKALLTVAQFLRWLEGQNVRCDLVRYADLLAYVDYCKSRSNVAKTINMKLAVISHLYDGLMAQNLMTQNPVQDLRLKRKGQDTVGLLLTWDELKGLLDSYNAPGVVGKRNKVMLGMLIYQGLTVKELTDLQIENVDLKQGKVEILAGTRTNGRILDLSAGQVLSLQKYITDVRPMIMVLTQKQSDRLFISSGKGPLLNNTLSSLLRRLKKRNENLLDLKQIRASVITYWLKHYHVREVQYMVGHRYVSSTERYQENKLEGLQDQIDKVHPLK